MQDNNFNAKEQGIYAPPGASEFHLVDRNNGNCLRYPSISNDPVAVWGKFTRIADIQPPKRFVHDFRTVYKIIKCSSAVHKMSMFLFMHYMLLFIVLKVKRILKTFKF